MQISEKKDDATKTPIKLQGKLDLKGGNLKLDDLKS